MPSNLDFNFITNPLSFSLKSKPVNWSIKLRQGVKENVK